MLFTFPPDTWPAAFQVILTYTAIHDILDLTDLLTNACMALHEMPTAFSFVTKVTGRSAAGHVWHAGEGTQRSDDMHAHALSKMHARHALHTLLHAGHMLECANS